MASEGQDRADALGWGRRPNRPPNRPKTFARNPTIPQKVTNVSIYDKGPEPLLGPRPSGHLIDYRSIAWPVRPLRRYPPACPYAPGSPQRRPWHPPRET